MRNIFEAKVKGAVPSMAQAIILISAPAFVLVIDLWIGAFVAAPVTFGFVAYAAWLVMARKAKDPESVLNNTIEANLRRSRRGHGCTALILLEIDELAKLSWDYEEETLKCIDEALLKRFRGLLRGSDRVICLRFGVYAVSVATRNNLEADDLFQVARRLQSCAKNAIRLDRGEVLVTFSVGFCSSKRLSGPRAPDLVEAAQGALEEAKRHGPAAVRSFYELTNIQREARSSLIEDLHLAIARGELRAYFQPQISARTGEITGFEALVRWHHPERGVIPPMEFLPLLERSGDMIHVTRLMVSQAVHAISHWYEAGVHVPCVGVNFSESDLRNPDLVTMIELELDRYGVDAGRLSIEVLEHVAVGDRNGLVAQNLRKLGALGCAIELDDFGTGHASLTNISRLSVERIKIDRSFVTGLPENPEQQRLVRAIMSMADSMGLATVAEGVETDLERSMLAQLGCTHLQGFGIGRPMPLQDTDAWIEAYLRQLGTLSTITGA